MRGEAGPYSPLGRTEVLCVECYDLDTQQALPTKCSKMASCMGTVEQFLHNDVFMQALCLMVRVRGISDQGGVLEYSDV